MERKIKERIKKAVSEQDQPTLFSNKGDSELVEACVAYLRYKGYRIADPVDYKTNVKNLDDLIKFFYTMLEAKYPKNLNVYRNFGRDRAIAKAFVKSRMEATGFSEAHALKECAEIITVVFRQEKDFHLKFDISFGMFGQQKLGWITEKAINIINNNRNKASEARAQARIDQIEREQVSDYELEFTDVDSIIERMEKEANGG